jgi:hypothetical protein
VTYDPKRIAPKQLVQAIWDVAYDVDIERAELVNKELFTRTRKAGKGIAYQLTKLPDK